MAPSTRKNIRNGQPATDPPVKVTPNKEESKRMRDAKLRKKEQQDERKKRKEEKRAARKTEAEQKKREQAEQDWERAEEEDRRKRTNPRKYVSFVNISFDVPHPKEQKPLMVWRD